jgi:hypothetical protein
MVVIIVVLLSWIDILFFFKKNQNNIILIKKIFFKTKINKFLIYVLPRVYRIIGRPGLLTGLNHIICFFSKNLDHSRYRDSQVLSYIIRVIILFLISIFDIN